MYNILTIHLSRAQPYNNISSVQEKPFLRINKLVKCVIWYSFDFDCTLQCIL